MPIAYRDLVQPHLDTLKSLQTPRGLFLASPKGVVTGYDRAWLRDNFYMSLALERAGEWEVVQMLWRAILNVLLKHEGKINWAVEHRPYESWQYIHARYHPETFEEFWEEWGNKQNDAVGAILFKLGALERTGHGVITKEGDRRIVQKLVDYLRSIEYWHDPDSGMWEEYEEVHASSVGAALAGIESVDPLPYITVPREMIYEGGATLNRLLPRESESKFADLALLSLIYPYEIVSEEMARRITENVAYHFARRHGVIRYKNDRYYNKNDDGYSEEAEWTMGLSWLAIAHHRCGNREKAQQFLAQATHTITDDGKIPELYYSNSDRPNENIPLGWAESMFIAALIEVGSG